MAAACAGAVEAPEGLSLELVADGFSRPVVLSHAGDGSGRLFVVEQQGRIRIVGGGVFLNIASLVDSSGNEQGLLGLAFHPDHTNNGYFYVNYTHDPVGSGPDVTRVSRFEVSAGDPNSADPSSEMILLEFEQNASNHNGGDLHFGPDGYLYIATGDGGGARDQFQNAQNLGSLLGKLLRIDVDGGSPYAIPSGNPFVGVGDALDEIWAYGLRNPWRFSWGPSGRMWTCESGTTGPESREWVMEVVYGGNHAWPFYEGKRLLKRPPPRQKLVPPTFEYVRGSGGSTAGTSRNQPLRVECET